MRFILLIFCLLFSRVSLASDITWLAAAYVDTVNSANLKAGIVFKEPYEYTEERPHYYGSFNYADIEVGLNGNKVSLGMGSEIGHGIDRIGLSYAHLDKQDLAGVEAVISQMGLSVKLGYYVGLDDTSNKWLIGIGLGF